MSTRAQVIIKKGKDTIWFYRHSDGDPSGTLPTLKKFMRMVETEEIRHNIEQAAGWLIPIGREEMLEDQKKWNHGSFRLQDQWKVGYYEPCACKEVYGNTEYLYELDISNFGFKMSIIVWKLKGLRKTKELIEEINDFREEENESI